MMQFGHLSKVIVYSTPEGGVRVSDIHRDAIAALTAKKPLFDKAWCERNVARMTLPPEGDLPRKTEAQVRPWCEAMAKGGLTEAKAYEVIAMRDSNPSETWRVVDRDKLPPDRTFRNAWTDTLPTKTVDVDMVKARDIRLGQFRAMRKPLLETLDTKMLRAIENGDKTAQKAISARKKALRDLPDTANLSAIQTPEELAAFLPAELNAL